MIENEKISFVIIGIVGIFLGCSKENTIVSNLSNKEYSVEENPFNFVGEMHNELVNSFALQNNLMETVSNADIFYERLYAVYEQLNVPEKPDFGTFRENIMNIDPILEKWSVRTLGLDFYQEELAMQYFNLLSERIENFANGGDPSPDIFGEMVTQIENEVLAHQKHTKDPTLNSTLNKYDMVLVSLAVIKYSYRAIGTMPCIIRKTPGMNFC